MKKLFSVFIFAILLLSITACNNTDKPSSDSEVSVSQDDTSQPGATNSDSAVPENNNTLLEPTEADDLGDYYVKILDFRQDTDYNGNNSIIISFEYTNNNSESQAFATTIFPVAVQDGETLEQAYFLGSEDNNIDAYIEEIEPGDTITVDVGFILLSDSPVEVNVTGSLFNGETNVSKTFTLE